MSRAVGAAWRERAGNAALLSTLAGIALVLATLQPTWPSPTSSSARWLAAAIALLVYLVACAALSHARRSRAAATSSQTRRAADSLRVVFASQTGMAQALAQRTVESLRKAGVESHAVPIAQLDASTLMHASRLLFVVSTTGEGDAPDMAASFERDLLGTPRDLAALQYGILTLGDREYVQFCGFGRRVDQWLRRSGATPMFDLVEVDNGDVGALRHWLQELRHLIGASEWPDWDPPRYRRWRLDARQCLNPGSQGEAVFHIELQPEQPEDLDWQAGDIAEIGPRHAQDATARWLEAHGLDPATIVEQDGRRDPLATWLARSHWPERVVSGADATSLVASLAPLPHREYSIASLPSDGALHLLVRQMRRPDGSLGLGSAWLTEHVAPGESIDLRLRTNPHFHLPDGDRPLLLVGSGTGIAGLRALLKARIARGQHRNWLVFGERAARVDRFYTDELERWRSEGRIEWLDLVYSRDGQRDRYVQHRLAARADEVRDWCTRGAAIFVCGSREGMGRDVDAALRDVLGKETLDAMRNDGRYRRDVY
jgi:sulfite reductase (NADPH) flavoprotein alpha-component